LILQHIGQRIGSLLKWVKVPENAIGVTPEGLTKLINSSGLKQIEYYPENWKEQPGIFFQDILIFEK